MQKILVIEDEELLRSSLIELLEIEDYEVIGAKDGVDGVQKAVDELPDLIICDIMMPRMNGYEVIKNLKENPLTETIPFIFLTAKADKVDSRFGMDLGADDYLTKPFNKTDLYNSISSRIKKQKVVVQKYDKKIQNLKSNLASTLPHELRTPLNGILASSQFLLQEVDDLSKTEVRELLHTIYTSGKRLSQLVTNYLLYSEIELISYDAEACAKLQNQKIYSIKEVIENVFKTKFADDNRLLDLKMNIVDAEVNFSESYFKKMCEELADNAFKFSERNQTVKISTEVADGNLFIRVANVNNLNINITADDVSAYVQFNRDNFEQQGSGMGLAIIKKLMAIYNGKLNVKNLEYNYIEFSVQIPNAKPSELVK